MQVPFMPAIELISIGRRIEMKDSKLTWASRNLSDGTYQEIKGGKISTHKEITSALDGLRFAEDQMKDGHGISGLDGGL